MILLANANWHVMQKLDVIGGVLLHMQSGGDKLNRHDVQVLLAEQLMQGGLQG